MTSKDPLVSIIVPVYGTEAYLPACIESICQQSYTNLQIILVDDQSPDRCPDICDSYALNDPRILVIHQSNLGVSGARNAGLNRAIGEYIMFVDSDDELYSDAVKIMLSDAKLYGADIVSATKRIEGNAGSISRRIEDGSTHVFCDEEAIVLALDGERNTNSACAKLFRTLFIQGICFENGKNINEDGFFVFLCYLKQPVLVHHNIDVYQYNARQNSGSRQTFSDKYLSMLYFCERKKELIATQYPQLIHLCHNMEVRTNLQMLDVLCRTKEKQYKVLQRQCVHTVRRLHAYHKPINKHYRLLSWITACGLYPVYKRLVRLKYYR